MVINGVKIESILTELERIQKLSEDRSKQTAAIIINPKGERIFACNNYTAGVDITDEKYHLRPEKYLYIEHAERNAIYRAAKKGISIHRATMICTWFPCVECARAIIKSGIKRLYYLEEPVAELRLFSFDKSLELLKLAGVKHEKLER